MLAANVCAARFLEKHELPGLYRVHEGPREEKLNNLREFLGGLGLSLPGRDIPRPENYQALLQSIEGRPDANLIQTVMLRSLSQAVYQPDNKGHFGLGYTAYAHFTSPIRRYPDLLMHRALRHIIRSNVETKLVKRMDGAKPIPKHRIYPYAMTDMLSLGERCSLNERRADEATRDVVSWLKCEYLSDRVGEEYEGLVVGVTGFGLFVELKDLYVEGLVHITNLPHDYYQFEPAQHRLVGERTRQVFRLGDELTVKVASVNLDDRKVDLEMVAFNPSTRKTRGKSAAPAIDTKGNRRKLGASGDADKGRKAAASRGRGATESRSGEGRDSREGQHGKRGARSRSEDARPASTSKKSKPSKGKRVRKAKSAKAAAATEKKSPAKPKKR